MASAQQASQSSQRNEKWVGSAPARQTESQDPYEYFGNGSKPMPLEGSSCRSRPAYLRFLVEGTRTERCWSDCICPGRFGCCSISDSLHESCHVAASTKPGESIYDTKQRAPEPANSFGNWTDSAPKRTPDIRLTKLTIGRRIVAVKLAFPSCMLLDDPCARPEQ